MIGCPLYTGDFSPVEHKYIIISGPQMSWQQWQSGGQPYVHGMQGH